MNVQHNTNLCPQLFENKVDHTTYFGANAEYIQGQVFLVLCYRTSPGLYVYSTPAPPPAPLRVITSPS